MSLFPQSFIDDLKAQTDIVTVIGEVTPLKKAGVTYKGLCPFHGEKTPSFNVNGDKGFFKCFGCGAGGDVVKFVEMSQKVTFPEAVRWLANRIGMTVPEGDNSPEDRAAASEREALVKLHEVAAEFFKEQLAGPAGARSRRELEERQLTPDTIKLFGYGFAPAAGRETLHGLFASQKIPVPLQVRSGLVMERDEGRLVDRFRNRLMIPIGRDSGAIVAFGGRALEEGQVPKYLNSPETPIYTKGRTLYGLDVTKAAIRKKGYAVLVEGYFDLAAVYQAGVQPVVASCGTALTPAQGKTLKRFASKVVLSFDPDSAGQTAAARSSELLVAEGFQVNVALLPVGSDPDTFIRRAGARGYVDKLKESKPYLEFLLDPAASEYNLTRDADRKAFLNEMLQVAATIPDAADRDRFADRLAHKARITEGVIRDEIRKAAAQKKTEAPAVAVPSSARIREAETGLLWALIHRPGDALAALAHLEVRDTEGLVTAPVLALAASLADVPADLLPAMLRERLSEGEQRLVERVARQESSPAPPEECVKALKRLRYERERAAVQAQIEALTRTGSDSAAIGALWEEKTRLSRLLEEM